MPRRKAGCSRASAFGKLGAQRAPNLCVVQMRCRVSGDLPIQASGGLRGFPSEVAHQDDGCLGPGAGGFGAEGSFGYAPDEALGYGPCHGGLGLSLIHILETDPSLPASNGDLNPDSDTDSTEEP